MRGLEKLLHISVWRRGNQSHYERALSLITVCDLGGGESLWLSDREWSADALLDSSRGLGTNRAPDMRLCLSALCHLEVAFIIVEIAAREIVDLLLLEGAPLELERHLIKLRWICARFQLKLIVLKD